MTYLIQLITAFLGTIVISVVFNMRRRHLIPAGLGGFIGWAIYLLMSLATPSEFLRTLIAASVIALYAEILARVEKAPTTIFLVSAAIPLFPGASLYRTMSCAVASDTEGFVSRGLATLESAAGIACGILCTMTLWYMASRIRRLAIRRQK